MSSNQFNPSDLCSTPSEENDINRGTGFVEEKEWKNPDVAHDPSSYIRYLDRIFEGMKESGPAKDYKYQVYEMMKIEPGDSIIDVGCGTGDDVYALSKILSQAGKGGKVVGVDISESMVREAQIRLNKNFNKNECNSNLSDADDLKTEFRKGDAQNLCEIPSNSFHICRSDRSLQHMPSPKAAIDEMVRILKPTVGRIIVSEPDWETLVIDSPSYPHITRKIINHFTDTRVNGWMGRQLPRLFRNAGLTNIKVIPQTAPMNNLPFIRSAYLDKAKRIALEAGVVTEEEAAAWMSELDNLYEEGQFFSSLTIYCVRGIKSS